jgi:type IV pilus assembly protein PilN
MIRINLLPVREEKRKERTRLDISVTILLFLLAVLVGAYLYMNISGEINTLQTQLREKKAEDARLTKKVGEIKLLKKKKLELQKKIGVINALNKQRMVSLKVMEELSIQIPEKVWFKSLQKKGSTLLIVGISLDDQTLSTFISRLSHSKRFTNVWLQQSKQVVLNHVKLKEFSLN